VLAGTLAAEPLALLRHKIALRLAEYARACARNQAGPRRPGQHDAPVITAREPNP